MANLKPVIGLEIHVELGTRTKMFCSCLNDPDQKSPNFNVCPVCMGHPGVLPVANEEAIERVIKTGLALNCEISEDSKFDRKSYFYPDLPKGYQISQFYIPFCKEGFLKINNKKIRIREIHLEEDTGRLVHSVDEDSSLADFNRAGVPLMELVTEPDINSANEAREFAQELQLILRYLNISKADMEKGQMRVEANISVGKNNKLGTKVEIKNINSFRSVERGIDYEIKRQTELLESGELIIQETRGWLEEKGETQSQRTKEEAHDYRYFPEPDLPAFKITKNYLLRIKRQLPELPGNRRGRFKKEYNLSEREIEIFVQNKDLGEYFEKVYSELKDWVSSVEMKRKISKKEETKLIKLCANYLLTDLQFLIKGKIFEEEKFPITPENFAEFITLIYEGKISSKIGKMLLPEMFKTGGDPSQLIREKGLSQIENISEIEEIAKKIISQNSKAIEDFKKGKETALQFLIGQFMKETKGKVNPQKATEILKDFLK
jgi:aspartyl-tRNA(Asn)/glutamyl-tRNA(Gln) amidotransferase subunit B